MSRTFLAPGKVVLMGEYAVLDGGPAVVAAVDRGVRCTVSPSPTRRIHTPSDDRFVAPALDAVDAPPADYRFADHDPTPTPSKAGLGGSAAATVVAVVAGSILAGRSLPPDEVQAVAHRVHHAVQGSGSGIDVAAAAHGGVSMFEAGRVTPLPPFPLHVAFSGASASTGPRVRQYLAWEPRGAFLARSEALVRAFATDPIPALHEAGALLGEMAEAAGIAYWTPGLRALVDLAHACGGGAKPSGAGGGDVVVARFPDPDRASDWADRATAAGFIMIPTRLATAAAEVPRA